MRVKSYEPGHKLKEEICSMCNMPDCTARPAGYTLNNSSVLSSPEEPYSTCQRYNSLWALQNELAPRSEGKK